MTDRIKLRLFLINFVQCTSQTVQLFILIQFVLDRFPLLREIREEETSLSITSPTNALNSFFFHRGKKISLRFGHWNAIFVRYRCSNEFEQLFTPLPVSFAVSNNKQTRLGTEVLDAAAFFPFSSSAPSHFSPLQFREFPANYSRLRGGGWLPAITGTVEIRAARVETVSLHGNSTMQRGTGRARSDNNVGEIACNKNNCQRCFMHRGDFAFSLLK